MMYNASALPCLAGTEQSSQALPLHTARPDTLATVLASLTPGQRAFAAASQFTGEARQLVLLPGDADQGLAGALLGLGTDHSPFVFGDLSAALPSGSIWHLVPGDYDLGAATLGFCLGAYNFATYVKPKREGALLVAPADAQAALSTAATIWMVRDLINTPANDLGPAELSEAVAELAKTHGAMLQRLAGEALSERYPVVRAVGAGSLRPPVVTVLRWFGSNATPASPHIALVGKGVCFDTGGYDLKPSAGMLRMKKDMGGAATAMGLARLVMEADLPVHLSLRIGAVENSVSGTAMRPSDVLRSRHGLSIEIGNTDAEGRLVLCDLLAEAAAEAPAMLLDFATLTGAARVALGPDLPALFCDDDRFAAGLVAAGMATHDPLWRLPLWSGYESWLNSKVADINNVSSKPMAGAITAALFLRRFVAMDGIWAHFDLYAWNDQSRPGRPEGGEAQTIRAIFHSLQEYVAGLGTAA